MLTELFCAIDDFVKTLPPNFYKLLPTSQKKAVRMRRGVLSLSEIMTILVYFHHSNYRTLKAYYEGHVYQHLRKEFPELISYSRFVRLLPRTIIPIVLFLKSRLGKCSGISFVDSTSINVCHSKRICRNKVFSGVAERGKTSMGWFYGFKLHFITNDSGEILAFRITKGNVDDRRPLPKLSEKIRGKLFGDKGYLSSQLFQELWEKGVQLITTIRKNMKNRLLPLGDKIMLRKRFIIETINDKLKNECQIEHTRHRSPTNFLINLLAGLIGYQMSAKKPRLNFRKDKQESMFAMLA